MERSNFSIRQITIFYWLIFTNGWISDSFYFRFVLFRGSCSWTQFKTKQKQTNKQKDKNKKADNDAKWLVHTGWFVRPCFLRNLTALKESFYSVVKCRLRTAVTLQKKILTSFAFNSDVARTRNMISQKPILTTGASFPWTVTVASPGRGLPCKVGLGILIENLD